VRQAALIEINDRVAIPGYGINAGHTPAGTLAP
jgi:hypothetical protein